MGRTAPPGSPKMMSTPSRFSDSRRIRAPESFTSRPPSCEISKLHSSLLETYGGWLEQARLQPERRPVVQERDPHGLHNWNGRANFVIEGLRPLVCCGEDQRRVRSSARRDPQGAAFAVHFDRVSLLGVRDPAEERRHGAGDILDITAALSDGEDLAQVVSGDDFNGRAIVEFVEFTRLAGGLVEGYVAPILHGLSVGARARGDLDRDGALEHLRKHGTGLAECGLSADEHSEHDQPRHDAPGSNSQWLLLCPFLENHSPTEAVVTGDPRRPGPP